MRPPIRFALVLSLPVLCTAAAPAAGRNPMAAVHADQWAEAQADAAGYADPVAAKLVLYSRLLDPGAATPAEIGAFIQANPDWPNQPLLERRRAEAIANDPDNTDVVAQCDAAHPTEPATLARCADALSATGHIDQAVDDARRAWITGLDQPTLVTAFLQQWGGKLTPGDEWARFENLAWHDPNDAERQIARLDPAHRPQAKARLALQHDASNAAALLAAAHVTEAADPGLMLDHVRYLRRAAQLPDALALWQAEGAAAQAAIRAAEPDRLPIFWAERSLLARALLATGDAKGAYALCDAAGQTAPVAVADAEFLAGFIALRKLNDPVAALAHFRKLAEVSKAAITQARSWYWQGRAEAAAGHDPQPDYRKAAAWPTTFYGQLAALALGDDAAALARRIDALHDPAWTRTAVLDFTAHEVVRAAVFLVAWGDAPRARAFLLRMDALAPNPTDRSLAATLALRLGLPDSAVFIARRMGVDGLMLPDAGWPMPFDPPSGPLDPAVALGIMRQESSFDIGAVSPSGARGLMQLMPFTAEAVAKQLGVHSSLVALTADPAHNMQLGTTYLQQMLEHFDGSLPLAVAAYNAGPRRVEGWLAANGDPRVGPIDMIDWIEEIPFNETRNYVQRVLENITIYRARRGEATPTLLAQWSH